MSLTNKQQELIKIVDLFNEKWMNKMDELNTIPAKYPIEGFDTHNISWEEPTENINEKCIWKLTRETYTNNNEKQHTVYYLKYIHTVKINKRINDIYYKQIEVMILNPTKNNIPNKTYECGGKNYGKLYYRDYLYKNNLVYKIFDYKIRNKNKLQQSK